MQRRRMQPAAQRTGHPVPETARGRLRVRLPGAGLLSLRHGCCHRRSYAFRRRDLGRNQKHTALRTGARDRWHRPSAAGAPPLSRGRRLDEPLDPRGDPVFAPQGRGRTRRGKAAGGAVVTFFRLVEQCPAAGAEPYRSLRGEPLEQLAGLLAETTGHAWGGKQGSANGTASFRFRTFHSPHRAASCPRPDCRW